MFVDSKKILRTFGRVNGRKLRPMQQRLVDDLLPKIAIDISKPLDEQIDFSVKDIYLEIGFGGGEHLSAVAAKNPKNLYIGCEPFTNGVARLLKDIEDYNIQNIRVLHGDARLLLDALPGKTINKIYILFPDPWPKARHHKKRLVNSKLLDLLYKALKEGGQLQIATDHVDYAHWIKDHLQKFDGFKENFKNSSATPSDWVETKYQQKARKEGREAVFFQMIKVNSNERK